jgi:hypothetical protein
MTAARRYREITGELTEIVEQIRQADQARAAELLARLGELDDEMAKASVRAELTKLGVALHWESALEALWGEQWMTLRPLPGPTGLAVVRDLDQQDARVEARHEQLLEAIRRRTLPIPRRDH